MLNAVAGGPNMGPSGEEAPPEKTSNVQTSFTSCMLNAVAGGPSMGPSGEEAPPAGKNKQCAKFKQCAINKQSAARAKKRHLVE